MGGPPSDAQALPCLASLIVFASIIMPDRSTKMDMNQIAARVVQQATHGEFAPIPKPAAKNRAAVSLGRRGGKVGGPARAASLTPEQRTEIAKKGAIARWGSNL